MVGGNGSTSGAAAETQFTTRSHALGSVGQQLVTGEEERLSSHVQVEKAQDTHLSLCCVGTCSGPLSMPEVQWLAPGERVSRQTPTCTT